MAGDVLYRIANWTELYENNRTRELKSMQWIPIPARLDGDGYTELIDHKNGAAHYGIWVGCVIVAARCDPRGTLVRGTKKPFCPQSLSRVLRVPQQLVEEAIKRFVSIGWMESEVITTQATYDNVAVSPQEGAGKSQEGALNGMEWKGKERKKEGNGTERDFVAEADLPDALKSDAFQVALSDWLAHKAERKERYKPTGLKKMLSRAANMVKRHGEARVIEAIEKAIADDWKGWDHPSSFADRSDDTLGSLASRYLDPNSAEAQAWSPF